MKSDDDELTVIQMRPEHFDEVLSIENEAFSNPWSLDDFEYGLREDRGGYAVVVLLDGWVIGYAVGFLLFEEFHLANLAIGRQWRRHGYGGFLLEHVLEQVHRTGALFVTLEVRMSNQRAIDLYRKYRFREIAIRREYYRHPTEDALVMMKVLGPGLFKQMETRYGLA
ncbi:MAG: ribosomal protein S18-alanine N-acetyltransferase [Candidatus Latescibacteria bacterium]|nr:ribosomal protein S18-alanine N-acetyltransferase [Candidatus Latescibacterota bacterium]